MSRKEKLAKLLESEMNTLPEDNAFGESNHLADYPKAIEYLRTGEKPEGYERSDFLSYIVDDIKTAFIDYGV